MATFDILSKPAAARGTMVALVATTAIAEQVVGPNAIFEIVATQPVTIRFGNASMAAPDANDYLLPANLPHRFELGTDFSCFRVYNTASSAGNVYYLRLTRN